MFDVMPDGSHVVQLSKPITTHDGQTTSIRLREPKYRDVMRNGDPETLILVEGGVVPQSDWPAIERYLTVLSGIDAGLLEQVHVRDVFKLKAAVLGFFRAATTKDSTT